MSASDSTGNQEPAVAGEHFDRFVSLLATDQGLVTVSTLRRDGSPFSSIVNGGPIDHPITGDPAVAFVSGGNAARLQHLRRDPRLTILVRRGWEWATVAGRATLLGPDDPHPDFESDQVPGLLRRVFQAAGGTHGDFNEFDRVMRDERRVAVVVAPSGSFSNPG